jgi:hypothetical protein
LMTKYCSHRTEISTKDIVTGGGSPMDGWELSFAPPFPV